MTKEPGESQLKKAAIGGERQGQDGGGQQRAASKWRARLRRRQDSKLGISR